MDIDSCYDPPLQYIIRSKTGALCRKGPLLTDEPYENKIPLGTIIKVKCRRMIEDRIIRLELFTGGWITENPKTVYFSPGQTPPPMLNTTVQTCKLSIYNTPETQANVVALDDRVYDCAAMVREISVLNAPFIPKRHVPGITSETLYRHTVGWSALPLRSLGGLEGEQAIRHTGETSVHGFCDTSLMKQCPYISSLITEFAQREKVDVEKARLMRLQSNGVIAPHQDFFENENTIRLHVPIIANPDTVFTVGGSNYILEAGRMYFVDVSKVHSVENRSVLDRIHLVFDVRATPELLDKIHKLQSK